MPAPGNWWGLTVTNWYTGWKNSPSTNYGVRIAPQNNANTFDTFISSRNMSDGYRPILQLDFTPPSGMPSFKMPLPGGATWLLTNEIGGYECMGEAPWPDTAHQGNSYFSIDISPTNKKDGGGSYGGDIPVLAAANGRVAAIGTDPSAANGYYITLNHSGLTSTTSGYTTKYIHLKNPPVLAVGVSVQQGDQIGIMGNTGNPTTGRHLHFGVYYDGSGASTKNELTYVTVDGWLMKSFQTECSVNSSGVPTGRIRYYHSSNRTY
jgi:murein DD-endopeptidase MepM/ murein hydrolase activator NlpD